MSDELAGSVRWAVVRFAPAAPFRLYAGPDREPLQVGLDALIGNGVRGGDSEFTFLTPGKARPVLILNDPSQRLHNEVTALRLSRFSRLDPATHAAVRSQRDSLLFHLEPDRFDLPEENAALVSALVRVQVSAIERRSRGRLNDDERRTLGERLIEFYGFDTRGLVERRIHQLAEQLRETSQP